MNHISTHRTLVFFQRVRLNFPGRRGDDHMLQHFIRRCFGRARQRERKTKWFKTNFNIHIYVEFGKKMFKFSESQCMHRMTRELIIFTQIHVSFHIVRICFGRLWKDCNSIRKVCFAIESGKKKHVNNNSDSSTFTWEMEFDNSGKCLLADGAEDERTVFAPNCAGR